MESGVESQDVICRPERAKKNALSLLGLRCAWELRFLENTASCGRRSSAVSDSQPESPGGCARRQPQSFCWSCVGVKTFVAKMFLRMAGCGSRPQGQGKSCNGQSFGKYREAWLPKWLPRDHTK